VGNSKQWTVGKFLKLEALRGFAAFYVFVAHLVVSKVPEKYEIVKLPFLFGQEAVMVFFLLSGFVIFYSTDKHKDKSFGSYFLRRWNRIYPIFLLAMLVAFICAYASQN
jgi:peptidoglycan/LPS O-acetylase OafA/YrhL